MECAPVLLVLICYAALGSTRKLLSWNFSDEGCRTPDYGIGRCIEITECKVLLDFISQNDNLSDSIAREIRKYDCGKPEDVITKVCCPNQLPDSWTQNSAPTGPEDHSEHKNIKLLPVDNCGTSSTLNKIIHGNITDLFEYPWAAVLKYERDVDPYACGASLINKRYILTAAHCIRSKYKLISVRLGEYNFSTPIDCVEGPGKVQDCAPAHQDFEVSVDDAIVHENYEVGKFANDIALIRLREDADLNGASVYPICLPVTANEKVKGNENYTVIGWGRTEHGFPSDVLLKVRVPTIENSECAKQYAAVTKITDNQLCAGGKRERDTCLGDSGGPLSAEYSPPSSTFITIQYGVVSFGPRTCGKINSPGVYTRVDKYMGWILDNMKP